MAGLTGRKKLCALFLMCTAAAISSRAQLNTLANFDGTDGNDSFAGLIQATDGNFYGTTNYGGSGSGCGGFNCGVVFSITSSGSLTVIYNFCSVNFPVGCSDGAEPEAALVQSPTDGKLYGTTSLGGVNGSFGTVFSLTTSGTLTTLYSFCTQPNCNDGQRPVAGLVQGSDGNFYGTNEFGGAGGGGTVFKITPAGALTTLYAFCAQPNCTDGSDPTAGLVQATDTNFYGTTPGGGLNGDGTVFKITSSTGAWSKLYDFCSLTNCTDGSGPAAGLIQATDGNLYGTTRFGGANNGGTIFKISLSGTLTTLYSFCVQANCPDGFGPAAGVFQASDGNLYGTTASIPVGFPSGGCATTNCGTLFRITPAGVLTTLYSFCPLTNCPDGSHPLGSPVQVGNGTFYGTTSQGGAISGSCVGCGSVFGFAAPLPAGTPVPSTLNFASQGVGLPSAPQKITFTNTGSENLSISSIIDANGFSQTNNCPLTPASLAPNQFCTIHVTFTPTVTGLAKDSLTITDNAIGSPQVISLSGTGVTVPIAQLAPSGLAFNTQMVGTTSTPQLATLSNTGGSALSITSIGLMGADATDFTQTNNCGKSLAVGSSCTIKVTFTPVNPGVSNATAILTVTDNASPSPQSVSVTGTAQTFALATNCTSLTVVPGQAAIYTVRLAPQNGFAQSVALSCSGAPALANCTVNPSSITLDGQTTIQAQVTATTTPATSSFLQPNSQRNDNRLAGLIGLAGMMGLAGLVVLPGKRHAKAARLMGTILCLCVLSTMATMSSCGGGGAGGDPPGTAAGTYPLTVTATFKSGSGATFNEKVSFNLVIQ